MGWQTRARSVQPPLHAPGCYGDLATASPSFTAALLNAKYLFFFLSPTGDGVPEQSRIRQDRQGKVLQPLQSPPPPTTNDPLPSLALLASQPDRFYSLTRNTLRR